MKRHQR